MINTVAKSKVSSPKNNLDREFWEHVKLGNLMAPQAADSKLIAYAFYKQALFGDIKSERPAEYSQVIKTLKHDCWKQLEGMPQHEAKRHYIKTIKRLIANQI